MEQGIDDLEKVMQAEVELGEALVQVLHEKQRAIATIRSDSLSSLTSRAEELVKPLGELEQERRRLTVRIMGSLPGSAPAASRGNPTVGELVRRLPAGDAVRLSTLAIRLKAVVERILLTNNHNRVLLQRSLRFVHEALRVVTEDHTRQLIDHRM